MDRETMFVPIPGEVALAYLAQVINSDNGCLVWTGAKLLPTRPGGPGRAVIVHDEDVYEASKVGWALSNREDSGETGEWTPGLYPLSYIKFNCGNTWCVAGEHIRLHRTGTRGKHAKDLPETAGYQDKYDAIFTILSRNPLTTQDEVLYHLKAQKLGGHRATVSAIIDEVRRKLGLPARVSRPRK